MGMWIKTCLCILFLCTVLSAMSGCNKDEYNIGEEFSLRIGETAGIKGEQLQIRFLEVSEDSRCPRNVTCVWEGRAVAVIEVLKGNTSQKIELIEQGHTETLTTKQFEEYEFRFRMSPYPEETEVQISSDEYRLMLIVNKEQKGQSSR